MVPMNMREELKKDCLEKLMARYARRNREGKSRMLDDLCEDYEYERKYAIKLLGGTLPPIPGRVHPGPERLYEVIEPVVKHIWLSAEQPCGKRLVPILRQWLPFYELRQGRLSGRQRQLVRQISAATLDRLLAPARAQYCARGRCGTKPGTNRPKSVRQRAAGFGRVRKRPERFRNVRKRSSRCGKIRKSSECF
jgi:hypothetical protein